MLAVAKCRKLFFELFNIGPSGKGGLFDHLLDAAPSLVHVNDLASTKYNGHLDLVAALQSAGYVALAEEDELLAQGKIEEAENYMEAERLKLVEKGHNLRRLNQAYFAFHGSYALSPTSVDPTGPELRQLRAASDSLKDFLDTVGWLNSYEDYQEWLRSAHVEVKLNTEK